MAIIKYKNPQTDKFETVEISGGTSVIANPEEAAAADLNKIQIDDTIYNVVGSGGGGGVYASTDVILDQHITTIGTYELDKSIDDYDYILCGGYIGIDGSAQNQWGTILIYKDDYYPVVNDTAWSFIINASQPDARRRVIFGFTDNKHIAFGAINNASFDKIYGIKFSKGGGSPAPIEQEVDLSQAKATASSTYDSTNDGPDRLIDKIPNTRWGAEPNVHQCWVQIELVKATKVIKYSLTTRTYDSNDANTMPRTWTLCGSNDETEWVEIDNQTDISWVTSNQTKTFEVKKPNIYKYYRINIEALVSDIYYMAASMGEVGFTELVGNNIKAKNVDYDNTESGLEAETVQEAIDELAKGGGGSITSFYEPIIPIHDSYSSNIGTISASSEYNGRPAWHAINGEEDNVYVGTGYWQAASYNNTQWIEYDFNEKQSFSRLTYKYVNRACTSNKLEFQYWDGNEWITVVEKSDYPTTSASAPFLEPFSHEFDIITTDKIRIYITLDGAYEQLLSSWQVYKKIPIYAKDISFDNKDIEMESTNVQDAIMELYNNGGGSGSAAEIIYENGTKVSSFEVTKDINNFDCLLIESVSYPSYPENKISVIVPIQILIEQQLTYPGYQGYATYTCRDGITFNRLGGSLWIERIQGIKFGGGSGIDPVTVNKYSEEESIIGVWKDNRPVYRIVGSLPQDEIDKIIYSNTNISKDSIIPVLTSNIGPDGEVSATNTLSADRQPYKIFNKTMDSLNNGGNSWIADTTAKPGSTWVDYTFNEAKVISISEAHLIHYADSGYNYGVKLYGIDDEGNETPFTEILKYNGASKEELTEFALTENTIQKIKAIRLKFEEIEGGAALLYNGSRGTYIARLYIGGTAISEDFIVEYIKKNDTPYVPKPGGGTTNIKQLSSKEYELLSQEEKINGTIYFVDTDKTSTAFDMTNISKYAESSMSLIETLNSTEIKWNGGSLIGLNYYYSNPIDVTNISSISYNLITGSVYGGGTKPQQERWYLNIALMTTPPKAIANPNHDDMIVYNVYDLANNNYGEQILDVSTLSGIYYLTVFTHGWNATINDIKVIKEDTHNIFFKDNCYSSGKGASSKEIYNSGYISTNTTLTIDNINDYKYISIVQSIDGNRFMSNTEIPIALFELNKTVEVAWDNQANMYEVAKRISDNEIEVTLHGTWGCFIILRN